MAEQPPEQQAALNRIQRAYHMGARELDLSELGLTQIPPEIGELSQIEDLSLSHNNLRTLPVEIGNLKNLKKLYLKDNDLREVPEVLFRFEFLEKLSLVDNKIYHDFPKEMAVFKNLKWLAMGNSFYTQTLKKAQGDNQFRKIPDVIWQLTRLEELYITAVGLTEISPKIEQLSNLRELFLTTNSIAEFPKEILELKNLTVLQIQNNPLPIPEEIIESKNARAITKYYFLQAGVKKEQIRESKLLIVGQGSVGKTSLVQRLTQNKFDKDQPKTENISIQRWLPYASEENEIKRLKEIEEQATTTISYAAFYRDPQSVKINIWDFGGQEIMHSTHQFFLTKRSLYLLVLDSRLTQEENRVEYWLKIIQSFGGESPILIVGNKIDQHPLDIDRKGLQKKYSEIVGILETSAFTGAGIGELKETIIQQIERSPQFYNLLPQSWISVKTQLEKLRSDSNFITYDKYLDICAENQITDETNQRTLIGFLHDLGVVLHFQDDPRLEALGILNPQWVTNGVYKILNSHTLFQNKGVLTTSMLDEILNLPEYPRGKRLFIVDMMKKFELCYDIEANKTFLVPDLLPKDQPDLKFNGVPAFEYAYPVLPSSVITRFIVRMNQHIYDGFVWRTGVVLKVGENKALVKADIEDRKITIAIDGLEHMRRDTLSAIRYVLTAT